MILAFILKSGDLLGNVVSSAWGGISWVLDTLVSAYSMPGWAILIMGMLGLFGLFVGILLVVDLLKRSPQQEIEPTYLNYNQDSLDGAIWRWRWSNNDITDLCCFCPTCDAQLVCIEGFTRTQFVCERCPSDGSIQMAGPRGRVVTTIYGGDRSYAVAATKREILRRIRTGIVDIAS